MTDEHGIQSGDDAGDGTVTAAGTETEVQASGGRGGSRKANERLLLRLLLDPRGTKGELTPQQARELGVRLGREPALAARYERLRRTWDALEAPPEEALPPGFARRLAARAAAEPGTRRSPSSLWRAPGWVQAAATVAFAVGLTFGSWMLRSLPAVPGPVGADSPAVEAGAAVTSEWEEADWGEMWAGGEPALAEVYLAALEAERRDAVAPSGEASPNGAGPDGTGGAGGAS